MHLIPVALKTHSKTLLKIMKIPLLGPLLILFYGILPIILADLIAEIVRVSDQLYIIAGGLVTLVWIYHLKTQKTEIKALFLPLWVWVAIIVLLAAMGITF